MRTQVLSIPLFYLSLLCTQCHNTTEEKYGREIRIISVDFSKGRGIYPNLANKQMQDLDIGTLGIHIITPRACARGKVIGCVVVVISKKITVSRGVGI